MIEETGAIIFQRFIINLYKNAPRLTSSLSKIPTIKRCNSGKLSTVFSKTSCSQLYKQNEVSRDCRLLIPGSQCCKLLQIHQLQTNTFLQLDKEFIDNFVTKVKAIGEECIPETSASKGTNLFLLDYLHSRTLFQMTLTISCPSRSRPPTKANA